MVLRGHISVLGPSHGKAMIIPLKWSQIQFWIVIVVIKTVGTPKQQRVHSMVTREALRRGSLKFQRRTVSQPGDEMPVQMPQPSDQMPVQMQQEFLTASTVLPLSYLLLRSCWKLLGSILNLPDKNTRDRNSLAFNTLRNNIWSDKTAFCFIFKDVFIFT